MSLGRVVVFKDETLAKTKEEFALKDAQWNHLEK